MDCNRIYLLQENESHLSTETLDSKQFFCKQYQNLLVCRENKQWDKLPPIVYIINI